MRSASCGGSVTGTDTRPSRIRNRVCGDCGTCPRHDVETSCCNLHEYSPATWFSKTPLFVHRVIDYDDIPTKM